MGSSLDSAFDTYRAFPSESTLVGLLEACQPTVFNICYHRLFNREDAEDAMQSVLLQIVDFAVRAASGDQFRSWVYRAALCRSLDLKRKTARRVIHESRLAMMPDPAPEEDGDAREALYVAMDRLDDRDRAILIEHYFERSSLMVLAARYGYTKVGIWKRLERARERLRSRLAGVAAIPAAFDLESLATPPQPPEALSPAVLEKIRTTIESGLGPAPAAAGLAIRLLVGAGLVAAGLAGGYALRGSAPSKAVPVSVDTRTAPRVSASELAVSQPDAVVLPEIQVESPSATQVPATPSAEHVDLLRKWLQAIRDLRSGKNVDLRTFKDLDPVIRPANLMRPSGAPEEYASLALNLYEVGAGYFATPFSESQKQFGEALRRDLVEALQRVSTTSMCERQIGELEADERFARGMENLLPPDQAHRDLMMDIDWIFKRATRRGLPDGLFTSTVADDWVKALGSDPSQRPILETAAELYRQSLKRVTEEFRLREHGFDDSEFFKAVAQTQPFRGKAYSVANRLEYQHLSLRAQWSALASLRSTLTHDQWERIRTASLVNYVWESAYSIIEIR
jgi:RNA polymerase sigma factor (sigma-70 family)